MSSQVISMRGHSVSSPNIVNSNDIHAVGVRHRNDMFRIMSLFESFHDMIQRMVTHQNDINCFDIYRLYFDTNCCVQFAALKFACMAFIFAA